MSLVVSDGNNEKQIKDTIDTSIRANELKPIFIQLNTIKGKGCLPMENNPEWHHKQPTTLEELKTLLSLTE